ncbi:hypothetical protein C8Q80DRAFT_1270752 [Daedaleopsis nitida]|nr:hypothetical protein C8Q80DRAFT_1270752 [Daedaleopsis nitida]
MAATWRLSFDLLSPALIVEPCSALAAQVLVDAPARLVSSLPSTISRNSELELTLIRNWVLKHRLYELVSSLPPSATKERTLINRVLAEKSRANGTLRSHVNHAADTSSAGDSVKVPCYVKKPTDLHTLPHPFLYRLLLQFAQALWPEHNITNELNFDPHAISLSRTQCAKRNGQTL